MKRTSLPLQRRAAAEVPRILPDELTNGSFDPGLGVVAFRALGRHKICARRYDLHVVP